MNNEDFEKIHNQIAESWIRFTKINNPQNPNYSDAFKAWKSLTVSLYLFQEGYTFDEYQQACMKRLRRLQ